MGTGRRGRVVAAAIGAVLTVLISGGYARVWWARQASAATRVQQTAAAYAGSWANDNAGTTGITRVIIDARGSTVAVHAFARCQPTDCDWRTRTTSFRGEPIQVRVASASGAPTHNLSIRFTDTSRTRLRIDDRSAAGQSIYTLHKVQAVPAPTIGPSHGELTDLASSATVIASATAPDAADDAGNPVNYVAGNVLDGDPRTAWRAPGDGRGVTLTLALPSPTHLTEVGLIPGYAKTDPTTGVSRFPENRRITAVRWRFGDRTVIRQTFADTPTMQRTTVDVTTNSVVVDIVSTVPGSPGFDYTAISEVSLVGYR